MRILIVMDPGILVPPVGYGGIERIVALLAAEYHKQMHSVDVLATKGSNIPGCNMYSIGVKGFPPKKKVMYKAVITAWRLLWKKRNQYDLVINFGRLLYLLPILNCKVKKIMCYQREITTKNIWVFNSLPNKQILFTGCSKDLVLRANPPGKWTTIYNAVDFNEFSFKENLPDDAPLIFLGRLEKIKGCHIAIQVARETGTRLIIAGNISQLKEEIEYFKNVLKPLIDGVQIMYVGEVNDTQKVHWLANSKALLMPIEWSEPFGIVMIEAMACGTPVIAFNRGSVSEVVDEDITGYKVETVEQMIEAVRVVQHIDRNRCREQARKRFDVQHIASRYLNVFEA